MLESRAVTIWSQACLGVPGISALGMLLHKCRHGSRAKRKHPGNWSEILANNATQGSGTQPLELARLNISIHTCQKLEIGDCRPHALLQHLLQHFIWSTTTIFLL
ncbi:hypothetical protein BX600DRAFT_447281, partial [Xylariales sp. PMI_506]